MLLLIQGTLGGEIPAEGWEQDNEGGREIHSEAAAVEQGKQGEPELFRCLLG